MVITSRSWVISFTVRVLGTLTSMPDCSTGAVTMKMISSTSTTSTSGVMLMSARAVCVRPLEVVNAISTPRFCRDLAVFDRVEHFEGEIVAASGELADGRSDQVVGDDRRNRGGKPCRRGD